MGDRLAAPCLARRRASAYHTPRAPCAARADWAFATPTTVAEPSPCNGAPPSAVGAGNKPLHLPASWIRERRLRAHQPVAARSCFCLRPRCAGQLSSLCGHSRTCAKPGALCWTRPRRADRCGAPTSLAPVAALLAGRDAGPTTNVVSPSPPSSCKSTLHQVPPSQRHHLAARRGRKTRHSCFEVARPTTSGVRACG